MARDQNPSLRRVLLDDLKEARLRPSVRQDLRDLSRFYLDANTRERLAEMGGLKRALWFLPWLIRSLLMKLSPGRRLALFASILLLLLPTIQVGREPMTLAFGTGSSFWAYVLLFVVFMLELKDKLLAKEEIAVARRVQLALLPQSHPEIAGWEVWSFTRMANDVGGDLVDYIDLDDGRIGIALGDVAGKGLGAALLAAKLQATLRALVPWTSSLGELATRVNGKLLKGGLDNRYATLFYLEIAPGSGLVRYLNAGHNAAYGVRGDRLERFPAGAVPLGLLDAVPFLEGSLTLDPDDLLVLYSDGLTEARNVAEEEFGETRLEELVPRLRALSPAEAGRRLVEEVERFQGEARPHDDLSLVVLRRVKSTTR